VRAEVSSVEPIRVTPLCIMPRHDYFIYPEASFRIRSRGRLPHWELDNALYSITIRLEDALPRIIVADLMRERDRAISKASIDAERRAIDRMFDLRIDYFADRGYGSCHLARPEAASIVENALRHFDGDRYSLLAYAVMPNHVHMLLCLFRGSDLAVTMHSLKSYTSNKVNAIVGRAGRLWEREYRDRIIRDQRDLEETRRYILENPIKAGLTDWRWAWSRV
jgi:REP element-mobilizing transposase RayT